MADVNEMFDEVTGEQSFFTPKDKKENVPFTKGEYLGHITKAESKVLDVQGKYKARLYSFTFEVDDANKSQTFTYEDITGNPKETDGSVYVGKIFFGRVWRFLEPKEGDDFESNSSGNNGYLRFCETIGIECPKETKNIDGQDIEVQLLPNLSSNDLLGQPVTAVVDLGKPWTNKEGERKQYYECKFCKTWKDGKKKTITGGKSDAIPF